MKRNLQNHNDKLGLLGTIFTVGCCLGLPGFLPLAAAVGLGFMTDMTVVKPLLLAFLAVTVAGLVPGFRRHDLEDLEGSVIAGRELDVQAMPAVSAQVVLDPLQLVAFQGQHQVAVQRAVVGAVRIDDRIGGRRPGAGLRVERETSSAVRLDESGRQRIRQAGAQRLGNGLALQAAGGG